MARLTAPMTEDQLAFLSEQTRHAARKAVRKYVAGALVGFAVLLGGVATAISTERSHDKSSREAIVRSGQAVAVIGCNRDFHQTSELRSLLIRARAAQEQNFKEGDVTQRAYERARDYFDASLSKLKQPDCRVPLQELTLNPDEKVVVPAPLYPKG